MEIYTVLKKRRRTWCLIFFILGFFVLSTRALASATNGTIDSTGIYAWGENTGFLNFGTSGGNVHVTDSGLTGYAWSTNFGWINLNPAGSGVKNNGEGTLSGSAWSEQLGYINFTGVTISSSGIFTGIASGTTAGRISFSCTQCKVLTDWRPASVRPSTPSSGGGVGGSFGGGGGGYSSSPFIRMNGGAATTTSPLVVVNVDPGISSGAAKVQFSAFADFRDQLPREDIFPTRPWNLCAQQPSCPDGTYGVWASFYNTYGVSFAVAQANIILQTPAPTPPPITPPPSPPSVPPLPKPTTVAPTTPPATARVFDVFKNIAKNVWNFFIPSAVTPSIQNEQLALPSIPRIAPYPLKGLWELLPRPPIKEYVFAPIPKEIAALREKLPPLENLFRSVGISRYENLQKLHGIGLHVPNLAEALALRTTKVKPGAFSVSVGIPTAALPAATKKALPTDLLLVRSADETLDYEITLSLKQNGQIGQEVHTVAGSPLTFIIKPEAPVKTITGYLVYHNELNKQSNKGPISIPLRTAMIVNSFDPHALEYPVSNATYDIHTHLAESDYERTAQASRAHGSELAVGTFQFTDTDNDGIYKATVSAPRLAGNYEVISIIKYQDNKRSDTELRLTTVVDPEGYVFEALSGGKEARIPNAQVALYWNNEQTKTYQLWPAQEYAQQNPQTTDSRGTYAFLVPEGRYYLTVAAEGYRSFTSKTLEVNSGTGEVHMNVQLEPSQNFIQKFDWQKLLIIVLVLSVVYNFYADRRRKR